MRRIRKAQSTAEYVIVLALVIGAAVAMQIYVKRGLQAKMKDAVDYNDPDSKTKTGAEMFSGKLYEPVYTISNMTSNSDTQKQITTAAGGGVKRDILGTDKSSRRGTQKLLAP